MQNLSEEEEEEDRIRSTHRKSVGKCHNEGKARKIWFSLAFQAETLSLAPLG